MAVAFQPLREDFGSTAAEDFGGYVSPPINRVIGETTAAPADNVATYDKAVAFFRANVDSGRSSPFSNAWNDEYNRWLGSVFEAKGASDYRDITTNDFLVPRQGNPPIIETALNDANTLISRPPEAPPGFFTNSPAMPPVLTSLVNTLAPGSVTPSAPSVLPQASPSVVIAPSQETNNFLDLIVNYVFPPKQQIDIPTASPAGGAVPGPVPAPFNDASFGSKVTPASAALGQRIDTSRSAPSGIPAQVAGTIRGLNIPGLSGIKNDKALILATLAAPLVALVVLWAIGKVFRRA